MNARELNRLRNELWGFVRSVAGNFGRNGRERWGECYLRGLMLDGERKSIEPMATRLGAIEGGKDDYEQALQQFVSQSTWDWRQVRDGIARFVGENLGTEGSLIIDDTGFPKWGDQSVGVARQYSGTLGKVDNCQIATTLQFAAEKTVVAIDAELYLPKEWTNDCDRLKRARVPQDVEFRPKWQLALELVRRAKGNGLCGIVLADSGYGDGTEFREALAREGWSYAVAISSSLKVVDAQTDFGAIPSYKGTGRPPSRPRRVRAGAKSSSVKEWAVARLEEFRALKWREGTKRELRGRFAAWRVRPAHQLSAGKEPLGAIWLLAEWLEGDAKPTKFYFLNLVESTSLKRLVSAVKERWFIEHSYKELKDELGLDHFEGRTWPGWHHHVTLVFMAYAFLQIYRRREEKRGFEFC